MILVTTLWVSVPLRGFDGLKAKFARLTITLRLNVSVPLRGFDGLKVYALEMTSTQMASFSPLAGI